jgi:hypothetical protein
LISELRTPNSELKLTWSQLHGAYFFACFFPLHETREKAEMIKKKQKIFITLPIAKNRDSHIRHPPCPSCDDGLSSHVFHPRMKRRTFPGQAAYTGRKLSFITKLRLLNELPLKPSKNKDSITGFPEYNWHLCKYSSPHLKKALNHQFYE